MTTDNPSKSTDLAKAFMEDHQTEFDDAVETGEFAIAIRQFDQWLVRQGQLPMLPDDAPTDTDRIGLVGIRNVVRGLSNSASVWGKHGWPPYKIEFRKGQSG
jgi:hypothetical protein